MSSGRSATKPHVELFTDGACSGNPGPGGWAYLLRDLKTGREMERSDGERKTTNNRMELMAVIEGLSALKQPSRVDLYSDSQYIVNGLRSWIDDWKARNWRRAKNKPVLNVELWQRLDELRQRHEINAIWVRGHSEHPENDRCDALAVQAIKRFQQ
jgi:ribonuclease HI